jgi:hypothetical protein
MGVIFGRHREVMPRQEFKRARQTHNLPDLWVAGAECEVDFVDHNLDKLLDVTNGLPAHVQRRVEAEEGGLC